MEINNRVCLTTYIYGMKYQAYIPFLVYSCHKAYPEYDIRLFLHEELDPSVRHLLEYIHKDNLYITEKVFADCPNMNALKAKSLRWVLWDDAFLDYDYLYVVDIDMLYIREPKPLHEQHVEHMQTTGLPYDNLVRCLQRHPFKPRSIAFRMKNAGLRSFFNYLFGSRKDYRLTGLHFIAVQPYYSIFTSELREKYKKKIYDGSFVSLMMSSNNEAFLYQMMKQVNLHPEKLAIQTQSYKMLDFNNCSRPEFRPHHGIHLGIFSQELNFTQDSTLDSDVYGFYVDQFKLLILSDPVFIQLYNNSTENIKMIFNRVLSYYKIPEKF